MNPINNNTPGNAVIPENNAQTRPFKEGFTKDDFMKIFLKQMQMQSPLKPYDSSAMLQQMSQLTSLSATENLDKTIKGLNESIGKSQVVTASQIIGRKVQVVNNVSPLVKGEGLSGSVLVPAAANDITITIKDSHDRIVKTISKSAAGSGVVDFSWDGLDGNNVEMNPDFYKISATATINGKQTGLMTAGTFKVGSVAMNPSDNSVILNVDGLGGIGMGDIIKII